MEDYIKGRGAQINTPNRFAKQERVFEREGMDRSGTGSGNGGVFRLPEARS